METIKPKVGKVINKKAQKAKESEEAQDVKIEKEIPNNPATEPEKKEPVNNENHIHSTENLDLESEKEEESSTQKVNFMDDNFMESMLKKKTKQSEEKNEGKEENNTKKSEEKAPSNDVAPEYTKEDMQDVAEVLLDIIDMAVSTALKFYSGDDSTVAYELNADKKRRLVRQLGKILLKYQAKFPLELMFIITLLICYSVPFNKARKVKAEIKAGTFKRGVGNPRKA